MSEAKKTGIPSTEEALQKANQQASRLAELELLFEELEAFVCDLSLTDLLNALVVLRDSDHAALAGLVTHFMVNAMNMCTGGE